MSKIKFYFFYFYLKNFLKTKYNCNQLKCLQNDLRIKKPQSLKQRQAICLFPLCERLNTMREKFTL